MGSGLFGGKQTTPNSPPQPPAAALRVQSSVQGKARALVWGRNRLAGNILWYGDFHSVAIQQQQSSGGGGGKGGGGSPPSQSSVTYQYYAYVAIALCEGPIGAVVQVWDSHGKVNRPALAPANPPPGTPAQLIAYLQALWQPVDASLASAWNLALFNGTYTQDPWGYLSTNHPDEALNYRGLAYVAFEPIGLGDQPDLPNLSFEVQALIGFGAPDIPDANVKDVVLDVLTNQFYGASFPSDRIGTMRQLFNYSAASGLLVSPVLVEQQDVAAFFSDLAKGCNFEFRWSNGLLDAVPYGDQAIAIGQASQANEDHAIPGSQILIVGHGDTFIADVGVRTLLGPFIKDEFNPGGADPPSGHYIVNPQTGQYGFAASDIGTTVTISYTWAATASYVPDTTPIYDITDDDILPGSGGGSSGADMSDEPVATTLKRPSDTINEVKIEYLDRANDYNPVAIDRKDEAAIIAYRPRPSDLRSMHFFCLAAAADLSATLQLVREAIPGTYVFVLPPQFILVDVLDLLTLTRPIAGMAAFPVRVTEIEEAADGALTFTCEDWFGTASAPLYGRQASSGFNGNANVAPGPVNMPLLFEPTAELLGGADLQIWAAISGSVTSLYGGCNVYASFDGETYQFIQQVRGPARMGVLTAPLPAIAENPTGPTIDTTNVLSVDLAESASELLSGTNADIASLASACYLDGEVLAYREAALTSQHNYDLSYLSRGAFGTETAMAGTHPTGTPFARLDAGVARIPFDKSRIGQTLYLKFQAFNNYGGGLEDLSTLAVYNHVITGIALTSPLPTVINPRLVTTDLFQQMWWDDVADFRTGIRYKVLRGDTFAGAQEVADVAHAPIVAFGEGTFWVVAYCQPVPGLFVYSENPVSLEVAGNMITENLVYQSDQQAAGWPGIFSNGVGRQGDNLSLGGSGDILSAPDFLNIVDVIHYGGVIASGTYEIGSADYVDCHYLATCYVNASIRVVGVPALQDVLTMEDFLAQPDVLGSASTQYVNAKIQIAIATDPAPGDLYDAGDLYAVSPDLYGYGIQWSDWQDFVPGVYHAWLIKLRVVLETVDPNSDCVVEAFSYSVSVPARVDHYPFVDVPVGGATVTFEPDSAAAPSPFNGGPPVGGVSNQALPVIQYSWSGQPGIQPVVDSLTLSELVFHFEDDVGAHVAVNPCSVTVEGF